MGKRKRKHSEDSDDHILKKIRRLEKRLRRKRRLPSDISSSLEEHSPAPEPASPCYRSDEEIHVRSDYSDNEPSVRSIVVAEVHDRNSQPPPAPPSLPPPTSAAPEPPRPCQSKSNSDPDNDVPMNSAPADETLSAPIAQDILDALGESKSKDVPLGAKIPDEISKRWGRILTDGLSKEHKQELTTKMLIPENFQLLKAPVLNQEIAADSGIDTSIFSAHSVRHASTSAANRKGISIDTIKKTAGWSGNSLVFSKFYNQPLITYSDTSFAEAVCNDD